MLQIITIKNLQQQGQDELQIIYRGVYHKNLQNLCKSHLQLKQQIILWNVIMPLISYRLPDNLQRLSIVNLCQIIYCERYGNLVLIIQQPINRHNSISTILSIVSSINGICTNSINFRDRHPHRLSIVGHIPTICRFSIVIVRSIHYTKYIRICYKIYYKWP